METPTRNRASRGKGECVAVSAVKQPDSESEKGKPYNPKQDTLYRWYLQATIAGAAVGLLGLWFLYRQSKATAKSADAALQNANAVINAERAWISVTIERCPGYPGIQYTEGVPKVTLRWVCRNAGRTPAMVFEKIFNLQSFSHPLPDIPQLDLDVRSVDHETQSLAGGDEVHGELAESGKELPLVFYGVVKYRDVLQPDQIRESYFAYTVTPMGNFERLPGYPNYNKYT